MCSFDLVGISFRSQHIVLDITIREGPFLRRQCGGGVGICALVLKLFTLKGLGGGVSTWKH